jgi:hypothetical protein
MSIVGYVKNDLLNEKTDMSDFIKFKRKLREEWDRGF